MREVFIEHDAASEHRVCVVREPVEGATLEEWLAERGGQPATEGEARVIAEQVLEALAHLHALSPPLLHGALSPKHVLRDPLGKVTLVGHDPRLPGDEPQGSSRGLGFIAPEVATGVATPASDLFALGATLAFALTGLPLDRLPRERLRIVLPTSLGWSPPFAMWLARLLEPAPEDRWGTAADAREGLRTARDPARPKARSNSPRLALMVLGLTLIAGLIVVLGSLLADRRAALAQRQAPPPIKGAALLLPRPDSSRLVPLTLAKFFHAHTSPIAWVATDGKRVFTSGASSVRVWPTDSWAESPPIGKHIGAARFVGLSPDAKLLVTTDRKGLHTFDATTLAPLLDAGGVPEILHVAFSPDGSRLFAACADGVVRAFGLPNLEPGPTLEYAKGSRVEWLAVSHDGKLLAAAGKALTPKLWRATDLEALAPLPPHQRGVDAVIFSRDGSLAVTASDDGTAHLVAMNTRSIALSLTVSGEAWRTTFNPDETSLLIGDSQGTVRSFSPRTGELQWAYSYPEADGVTALTFTPDGKRLLVGRATGGLEVLDVDARPSTPPSIPSPRHALVPRPPPSTTDDKLRAKELVDRVRLDRPEDLRDAEEFIDRALKAAPSDPTLLTQKARLVYKRAYRRGSSYELSELDRAAALLDHALELDPSLADAELARAWVELFRARSIEDDPRAARAALDRASDLTKKAASAHPDPTSLLRLEADLAVAQGDYEVARRIALDQLDAATFEEDAVSAYSLLSDIAFRQHAFDEGLALYAKVVELSPRSAWAHGNYARLLFKVGRLDEAAGEAQKALSFMNYRAAHILLAEIEIDRGIRLLWDDREPARARASFEAALREDPTSINAQYGVIAVDLYVAQLEGTQCPNCLHRLEALAGAKPKDAVLARALAVLKAQPQSAR